MRVVIGWVITVTMLAVTVLGAASAQNSRGVAIWVVLGVTVAAGWGALSMSVNGQWDLPGGGQ